MEGCDVSQEGTESDLMPKKRLLVLAPRFPYPPIGGDRLRIYQLCKQLAVDFELTLLCMCDSDAEMKRAVPDDGIFNRVERVFHGRMRQLWGCLSVLPSRTPFQVGYFWNREFERRVRALSLLHQGLFAHLIRTGSYMGRYDLPKILEMTDAISLAYSRAASHRGPLLRMAYRWEASRLASYERELIDKCDLTVLVSRVDRDSLLSGKDSGEVLICSNGVDARALPFDSCPDGKTIVFIGKNIAFYNVDGILYFAQSILPRIQARRPDARFKVVGQIKRKLQLRLQRLGVIVTGGVEEIPSAARNASVAVCPLRIGAGVQNKLLEYMSLGIPAVTSSVGLEGLDAKAGVHLLVADTPEEWTDEICGLLENPKRGESLAIAGRQFVERYHNWPSLIAPLRARIAELLEQHSPTTEPGAPLRVSLGGS